MCGNCNDPFHGLDDGLDDGLEDIFGSEHARQQAGVREADAEPSSVIAERARISGMPFVTGHHVAWARKCGFIRRQFASNLYYGGTFDKSNAL